MLEEVGIIIQLENVSKAFNLKNIKIAAVNDVSLTVEDGEIFGVIGFSGAGKSTLIRLFNLLERPDQGSIIIDGQRIETLSDKELRLKRQKVAMIFQQFNLLWSLNVYENIALPLKIAKMDKNDIKRKVDQLLDLVDLKDKREAYPAQLSGGQKQRVGIARALANDPKILLCDEATSALDPETTRSILELLKRINTELGVTIIMISHEMSAIRTICDRVGVMDKGKIIEVNDVHSLFLKPQHDITKSFVQDFKDPHEYKRLVDSLKQEFNEGIILQLTFPSRQSGKPLLSRIIIANQLSISILHGQLWHTSDGTVGSLYVHVDSSLSLETLIGIFQKENIVAKEV